MQVLYVGKTYFACNTTPVKCLYSKWGTAVINGDDYDSLIEMMVTDIPIFIASRPNISNEIEDVVNELVKDDTSLKTTKLSGLCLSITSQFQRSKNCKPC